MDKNVQDVRRAGWFDIVTACQARPDGISAKRWLAENGIKEKAYYYWQSKFRREACAKLLPSESKPLPVKNDPSFVEIPLHNTSALFREDQSFNPDAIIRRGDLVIALSNSCESSLINTIMEGINNAH